MNIFLALGLTLAIIFNSIECSSQFDINPRNGRNPSPAAENQHSPDRNSTVDPSDRVRSRSPADRPPPTKVLGHYLKNLGFIRLVPRKNQNQRFEFRRYISGSDTLICWKTDGNICTPIPAQEHIVLSTSDGDIFAILAYTGYLRGIYRRQRNYPRVKMNMISGAIQNLNQDEFRDCPVGKKHPIFPNNFIEALANYDTLKLKWNHNGESIPVNPPSTSDHSSAQSSNFEDSDVRGKFTSPPGRPSSDLILGYTRERLGYVRLIPRTNPNQRFEFRRYVFPVNKRIRVQIDHMMCIFEPNREYIVLSTSNGDVCAILQSSGILRGIYGTYKNHPRKKVNIISGAVDDLTADEISDCPVGKDHPIFPNNFIEAFANSNSLQSGLNHNSKNKADSSTSVKQH